MELLGKHGMPCLAALGLVLMATVQASSFAAGPEPAPNARAVPAADVPRPLRPQPPLRKRNKVVQGPVKPKTYPTKPQKAIEKLR